MKKIATKARFTYISKRQSDFAISRGFYFHETSHMRSFEKINSSRKFPNLQYTVTQMSVYLQSSNTVKEVQYSKLTLPHK